MSLRYITGVTNTQAAFLSYGLQYVQIVLITSLFGLFCMNMLTEYVTGNMECVFIISSVNL